MKETITWNNKTYPERTVCVPGFGDRTISVESLEEALFSDSSMQEERQTALDVDSMIFFYVPDDKITLPDDRLGEYVQEMIF